MSLLASGRLTARLIVDGAISFAFIPIVEVFALLVVLRLQRPRDETPFARLLSRFLAGNAPWLLWMAVVGGIFSCVPPRAIGFGLVWSVELSAIVPIAWSFWIDVHLFREITRRSSTAAVRDALVYRAIAWSLGITYFFGTAIWSLAEPTLGRWAGR